MVGVHLNWLNWFQFFLVGDSLVIPLGFMIFTSPFIDFIMMPMSTFSSFVQVGSGIFCLHNTLTYDTNDCKTKVIGETVIFIESF